MGNLRPLNIDTTLYNIASALLQSVLGHKNNLCSDYNGSTCILRGIYLKTDMGYGLDHTFGLSSLVHFLDPVKQ